MGLYLQRHQEVPPEPRLRAPRPLCSDDDGTLHGRIREAPHPNMPQTWCPRNGWYGSTDPHQG